LPRPARPAILGVGATKPEGESVAELEPGHPDTLVTMLRNWLREAQDPIGSLTPGTDPVEWAVRRFIAAWQRPVRDTIDLLEEWLGAAVAACQAGDVATAKSEIESAEQLVRESLRDELGLYEWNRDPPTG
jgi:hypothetical protein